MPRGVPGSGPYAARPGAVRVVADRRVAASTQHVAAALHRFGLIPAPSMVTEYELEETPGGQMIVRSRTFRTARGPVAAAIREAMLEAERLETGESNRAG